MLRLLCLWIHGTGKILYEKDADKKMYPASTTKIMTAILALENRLLTDTATVSYNAIFTVPVGYNNANLQLDETLTYEQLLHVLLIPSANDAANVIAEDIAGSVESFASMMNTKARELGCENTHFVNANGVHDENHYSTAYDLALIGKYAMNNETFRKLVSTVRYTLPVTNKYDKEDRVFLTTNRLVNPKSGQYYEYATGIKTGYTDAAKNCIVASAKKDNMELICVIMGAGSDISTDTNKFDDCITLFDYGFENYKYDTLCKANDVFKVITPRNASSDTKNLNVLYENDINALVKMDNSLGNFSPEVELDEKLKAPIKKGSVIGKISYTIDGIKYTTNLIAGQDILASSIFSLVLKIALVIFALYILKCVLNFINKGKKKKKKSKKSKSKKKSSKNTYSFYKFDY
ncbi:MAG: D-alanyl-D-alanine carboxypeptidase [Clostridia bacterium]|nr:D-alanyl-D-alanine carboxypeptidase [Clostridia bacterium]